LNPFAISPVQQSLFDHLIQPTINMKFTAAIAAAILAATSSLAAPAPFQKPSTATTLYPTVTSLYNVWTGAVTFNVPRGLVQKTGTSADITTLVRFDIPPSWANRKCQLVFTLGPNDSATGSQRADVFTSLAPATASTTTWPNGNLRDQDVGRLVAVVGGTATFEQAFNGAPQFDCPAGQALGGELVGVYDVDQISWDILTGGPLINLLP
jgi:hypothetical protein